MNHSLSWKNVTWIAVDTETTGKYPIESEICEIAAVKWRDGKIVSEYQQLIKPSRPMSETVIKIHNITNEMVATSPSLTEVLLPFCEFISDGYVLAHHAPFDMGFLTYAMEICRHTLPCYPAVCTSLLSRKIIPESPNHRLQTLIRHLDLNKGQAHRALDDAKACLQVAIQCFERMPAGTTVQDIVSCQGGEISWTRFSVAELRQHKVHGPIIECIEDGQMIQVIYEGGSRKGMARTIQPIGLVRSLNGDFYVIKEDGIEHTKRYFLDKISRSIR